MDEDVLLALVNLGGTVVAALITGVLSSKTTTTTGAGRAVREIPFGGWVLAHGLAAATASIVGSFAGAFAPHVGNWALLGAMIGAAQWIMLRRVDLSSAFWVPASIVGWAIFALANTPVTWAICGAVAGSLQCLALRREMHRKGLWIVTNAVGWLIAGNLGWAAGMVMLEPLGFALAWVLGWSIVGLIGGAITGWVANSVFTGPPASLPEAPRRAVS